MKKHFALLFVLILLVSCSHKKDIPELLEGNFDQHILTFEKVKPDVTLDKAKLREILVLLHHRIDEEKIKEYFKMNDSVWNERINYLFNRSLIKKSDEGKYLPTCFVLDVDNAISIKKFTDSLGTEMSGIAIDRLEKIKKACSNIPSLMDIPFKNISLFVLGSVIHDYWQDKFYQDQFIRSFIPRRGNTDYYFALFQNTANSGNNKIFETTFLDYENVRCGVYSLDNEKSIATFLKNDELKSIYLSNINITDSVYQKMFINDLITLSRNDKVSLDKNKKEYLEKHELLLEGKSTIPVITQKDFKKLYNVATIITNDLVNYFENRQTYFLKKYLNSQYKDETNYKEWITWIYKMISTKAANELIKKSFIKAPKNQMAAFIIEE